MRFPALLAFGLLLAAGCTQPAETPTTTPPPPTPTVAEGLLLSNATGDALSPLLAPPALAQLQATWLPIGSDAREPTLEVDSKGTVFYAARDYSGGSLPPATGTQTPVLRSDDGGLTWTEVSPMLPTGDRFPPTSGDPMIYLDPWTDRLFQVEQIDIACHTLSYTEDQGATWTTNPRACSTPPADHQTVVAGPSSLGVALPLYPNVVYVCVNQLAASSCSRSLDGGLTFTGPHLVYPDAALPTEAQAGCVAGGLHGHALVGPDGTVYLPRNYCGLPYVAVSKDDGLTWARSPVAAMDALGSDPSMAFDATGRVYYAWLAGDHRIHLVHSDDAGASWSPPTIVSPPEVRAANLPSIVAGDDGRLAVLYMGTTQDLGQKESDPELTWGGYISVSHDAANATATWATVRANPQGDVLKRGYCSEGRCGLVRDFLDIAVAPDGSVYGAFVDACVEACDTEAKDLGEGNANVGYVARVEAALYATPKAAA